MNRTLRTVGLIAAFGGPAMAHAQVLVKPVEPVVPVSPVVAPNLSQISNLSLSQSVLAMPSLNITIGLNSANLGALSLPASAPLHQAASLTAASGPIASLSESQKARSSAEAPAALGTGVSGKIGASLSAQDSLGSHLSQLGASVASSRKNASGINDSFEETFDNGNWGYLRSPSWDESDKVTEAARRAWEISPTARALQEEFDRKGGQYTIDDTPGADYHASFTGDVSRPGVVIASDMLNRDGRGLPWESLHSAIARAQVLTNSWYAGIPHSADKLAAATMEWLRVFGELTNSTSRPQGWATDKDFRDLRDGQYVMWAWYEKMLEAVRSGKHLNETAFYAWVRDSLAKTTSSNPAFQFSLWEMYTGKYYRPGTPVHNQAIPSYIPRIDRPTFDQASQKVFGTDGKGTGSNNVYSSMLQWLRQRGEI